MARTRAHGQDHAARFEHLRCRNGYVGIDISNSDGDARTKSRPDGRFRRQPSRACSQRREVGHHFGGDHVSKVWMQRCKELGVGELPVLVDRLISRRADAASLLAAQPPHHPVGSFDQAIRSVIISGASFRICSAY